MGTANAEFPFPGISLDPFQDRPGHPGRTLYPVTADSSALASTGSHLILTVEPEKVQEMFPGGLFGAEGCKTRQGLGKSGSEETLCWSQSLDRAVATMGDSKHSEREHESKICVFLGDPVGSGGVRGHSRGLVVVTLVEALGGPVPARL